MSAINKYFLHTMVGRNHIVREERISRGSAPPPASSYRPSIELNGKFTRQSNHSYGYLMTPRGLFSNLSRFLRFVYMVSASPPIPASTSRLSGLLSYSPS